MLCKLFSSLEHSRWPYIQSALSATDSPQPWGQLTRFWSPSASEPSEEQSLVLPNAAGFRMCKNLLWQPSLALLLGTEGSQWGALLSAHLLLPPAAEHSTALIRRGAAQVHFAGAHGALLSSKLRLGTQIPISTPHLYVHIDTHTLVLWWLPYLLQQTPIQMQAFTERAHAANPNRNFSILLWKSLIRFEIISIITRKMEHYIILDRKEWLFHFQLWWNFEWV